MLQKIFSEKIKNMSILKKYIIQKNTIDIVLEIKMAKKLIKDMHMS